MEHEKLAKSHGILCSVMQFTNFDPEFYQSCTLFADIRKSSIGLESLHFPIFSAKCLECGL